MALVTANDLVAAEARIVLPLLGAWHVDLLLAAGEGVAAGDAVTVVVGASLRLVGTARRALPLEDALRVRVVAGADGLATSATAKCYQGAQLKLVLGDLLGGVGEVQASSTHQALLSTLLPNWCVLARAVGLELAALFWAVPSTAWRFLQDGNLWAGPETWPAVDLSYELQDRDARANVLRITSEEPALLPGTTLDGDRIGDVEHLVTAHEVRTIARLA